MNRDLRSLMVFLVANVAFAISGCGSDSTASQTVGGTVSGLNGTVTLTDDGADALAVSASGRFTFSTPVAQGNPYAVAVQTQPGGQTCVVSRGSGTVGTANITNVLVACSAVTRTIGGTVSGLNGTVTLKNNGGDAKAISSDGAFTFATPVADLRRHEWHRSRWGRQRDQRCDHVFDKRPYRRRHDFGPDRYRGAGG
jgi:hypothetical protein